MSSDPSCTYQEDSEHRLIFEVEINPTSGPVAIAGLSFYEKAPINFEFNVGRTGPNNYPTLYTFRIYRDGSEIFSSEDVRTNRDWTLQSFNFTGIGGFVFDEPGTLGIEFLAFCPMGISSFVSAWDIDELSLLGFCQPDAMRIEGNVMTTKVEPLTEVDIAVLETETWESYISDDNGDFAFDINFNQPAILIEPTKDDDHLNGVSTLDLLKIQRHILGIENLETFSDLVAADINRDDKITAIDLIELRKLILGIYDRFPDNTSYRFLDAHKEYTFISDVNNRILMTELDEEIRLQAIKIGDVNESHISDVYGTKVDSRAESNFNLILREYRNKSGKLTVGFLASNDFELAGFQATLNVGDYKELGVVPHTLNITDNNHYYHNGVLKMSWSNQNMMIKKGALLFEIVKNNFSVRHAGSAKRFAEGAVGPFVHGGG